MNSDKIVSNSVICHQCDFKKNVEKEKRKRIYSLLKTSDKENKTFLFLQTSRTKAPVVSTFCGRFQKIFKHASLKSDFFIYK